MPISLGFFALTLVAFLLQVVPVVGIVMMMLAAPFWSVILVNMGFAGIAIEATIGLVSRLWLVVPALYFGGYAVAVQMSQKELAREIAAYQAMKPANFSFDPARNSLLLDNDLNALNDLMKDHAFTTIYSSQFNRRTKVTAAQVHRIGNRETCERLERDRSELGDLDIWSQRLGDMNGPYDGKLCLYSAPGAPALPAFRASYASENPDDFLLKRRLQRLTVTAPDGRVWEKKQIAMEALSGLPRPVIGCYMAGHYKWTCQADFLRDKTIELGDRSKFITNRPAEIAAALGVRAAGPEGRVSPLPPEIAELIRIPVQRQAVNLLKTIDGLVSKGHGFPSMMDTAPLAGNPQLWRHRIDSFVALFETTVKDKVAYDSGLQSLDALLAVMPEEDFRRVAPRLAAALAAKPDHVCTNSSAKKVFNRLPSAGGAALPAFAAILQHSGSNTCNEALESLCHLGAAGAPLAAPVQKIYRATKREGHTTSQHFHAYTALLAMGLRDQIVEDKPGYNPAIDQAYAKGRENVLAGRLKEGCSFRTGSGT